MGQLKMAALALIGTACGLCAPASAEEMKEGTMMMITPNGQMSEMSAPDKKTVEQMLKHAEEMKGEAVLFVWGHKVYVVKNKQMENGKMMFDVWGLHTER